MKNFLTSMLFSVLLVCTLAARMALAQEEPAASTGTAKSIDIENIIRTFTAKETELRQARERYSFKRQAVIQTIGMGKQITGEYHRVSYFTFDDQGKRYEKVETFPIPTLRGIGVTAEELDELGGFPLFALEASQAGHYGFKYGGKERIDDLDLFIFDVAPKVLPEKKSQVRYFQGRIWVDDRDLQIVKMRGKGVPEGKKRFPVVEIYREQIDGRYWLPSYVHADEALELPSGYVVHVRVHVRYKEFERRSERSSGVEAGAQAPPQASPPATSPAKP